MEVQSQSVTSNNQDLAQRTDEIRSKLQGAQLSDFKAHGDVTRYSLEPGTVLSCSNNKFDLELTCGGQGYYSVKYTNHETGQSMTVLPSLDSRGRELAVELANAYVKEAEGLLTIKSMNYLQDFGTLVGSIPADAWARHDRGNETCLTVRKGDVGIELAQISDHRFGFATQRMVARVFVAHPEEGGTPSHRASCRPLLQGSHSVEEQSIDGQLGVLYRSIIDNNSGIKSVEELKAAIPDVVRTMDRNNWRRTHKNGFSAGADFDLYEKIAESESYRVAMMRRRFDRVISHHWDSCEVLVEDKAKGVSATISGQDAERLFETI
jgi:hypothetical protein